MVGIKEVRAREVLDSRGEPTVEADVYVAGFVARASVPSGASKGTHEAVELRDGGRRYFGKGVLTAVGNINSKINRAVKGIDCRLQERIDQTLLHLDGSSNKRILGANSTLAVSMAACRAGAHVSKSTLFDHIARLNGNKKKLKMPKLFFNVINGGRHAGNELAIQECMIVPLSKDVSENVRIASEVYHTLKSKLRARYGASAINVGDEGGFAPPIRRIESALDVLTDTIKELGYKQRVAFAIDCAANEFYRNGKYELENGRMFTADQLLDFYRHLIKHYPIISIEDPFYEEDFKHYAMLLKKSGINIVADDLTATNPQRIRLAARFKAANCLLLKINQIGTLSEAFEAAAIARKNGWRIMISNRSGETTDDFIADLSVGLGAEMLKSGAPARGERVAKYNQLLRINEML